jgi:hypothetical protein
VGRHGGHGHGHRGPRGGLPPPGPRIQSPKPPALGASKPQAGLAPTGLVGPTGRFSGAVRRFAPPPTQHPGTRLITSGPDQGHTQPVSAPLEPGRLLAIFPAPPHLAYLTADQQWWGCFMLFGARGRPWKRVYCCGAIGSDDSLARGDCVA